MIFSRLGYFQGIIVFSVGIFLECLMDTAAKWVSTGYPLFQILLFRSFCGLACLLIFVLARKSYSFASFKVQTKLQVGRAVIIGLVFCLYVYSLKHLSLVNTLILFLTLPLFIVLLSRLIHQEEITSTRWLNVCGGFIGAILVVQPEYSNYGLVMLLPIVAAFLTAVVMTISKALTSEIDSVSVNINSTLILTIVCLVPAILVWEPIHRLDYIPLTLIGIFGSIALLAITFAIASTPMSVLAPFQYFSVVWTAVFGWIIWSDVPSNIGFFGITLIIYCGFLVARDS